MIWQTLFSRVVFCRSIVLFFLLSSGTASSNAHQILVSLGDAIRKCDHSEIAYWVNRGVPLNPDPSIEDELPIDLAVKHCGRRTLEFLVQNGTILSFSKKAVFYALEYRRSSHTLEYILENGARAHLYNSYGRTPLHLAAMDCEIPAIELLLRYKAIPDVTDRNLRTPLQTLVENADTKTCDFKTAIRFLLSAGAKIDRAFQGRTALEMALGLGNYSAARALLRFGAHLPLGSSLLNEANILASEIRVSQRAKEEARQSNHAIVLESVQDVLQFGRGSQRVERALYQALLKPNSMALEDFFSNGIASNEWVELIEFQLRMAHFIAMRVDWQWSDDYHTQEWNEKHTLFKMSFLSQNERWIHVLTVLERYLSVRFPLSQRNFLTKENWQALSEISNIIAEFLDDLGYWNLDQATSVSLLKESTKRLFSLFSLVEGKKESSRNQRAYTELIRHLNSRFSPIPTK